MATALYSKFQLVPVIMISTLILVIGFHDAEALTKRDFGFLNDAHLTALYGNTLVCGDHLCAPGEWDKLLTNINQAQFGNQSGRIQVSSSPAPTVPQTPPYVLPVQNVTTQTSQENNVTNTMATPTVNNTAIVLVHGAFVDGSGWEGVYDILKQKGYDVSIVQNPTVSLEGDVNATNAVINSYDKNVILVGHSYGGVVITEAGNNPKVVGLVYIAAFAPDAGESVSSLISNPPPGAPVPPILPPENGFLLLNRSQFASSFAADVDPQKAEFMADSQVPWGLDALNGKVTSPAWKTKPSWYLVTTEDKMIPPDAQRSMATRAGSTVMEATGSHAIFVSQPQEVANFIIKAAQTANMAGH